MALAATFFKWDASGRTAHVGQETDKANDGFEVAELEDASAGDEHFIVTPISGDGADDPRAVPTVMALLCSLLADHLNEVALGEQAACQAAGSGAHFQDVGLRKVTCSPGYLGCKVEIQQEILTKRLLGRQFVPRDDLAKRRKVVDGAHGRISLVR